jgi:hypothetical protein
MFAPQPITQQFPSKSTIDLHNLGIQKQGLAKSQHNSFLKECNGTYLS